MNRTKGSGNPAVELVRQEVPIGKQHCHTCDKQKSVKLAVEFTDSAQAISKTNLNVALITPDVGDVFQKKKKIPLKSHNYNLNYT